MRRATVLGGPRDGEVVNYCGPELRMPVPTPVLITSAPDRLPESADFKVDRYVARMDYDGRWWYVREAR